MNKLIIRKLEVLNNQFFPLPSRSVPLKIEINIKNNISNIVEYFKISVFTTIK